MPALAESRHDILRYCQLSQVRLLCFTRKLNLAYKAGFLTSGSSLYLPFSHLAEMQWAIEISLPCYSDRIAQDSHLIPSSVSFADTKQHSVRSYGIILIIRISLCKLSVNNNTGKES